MKYFAALDVSDNETWVCIVDHEGTIIKEGPVPTEPHAIVAFLHATRLKLERVGFEAGPLSPWLYHELLAGGVPVTCLETRHAKAALKAQNMKTDRNDARGLAQIVRTGWYKAVHIKSLMNQKLRVLLNNRRWLVDKRVDLENQIRGTLKVFGFKLCKVTTVTYEHQVRSLIATDVELQTCIEPLLHVREHLLKQFHILDKTIRKAVQGDTICQRLMTVPGVGPLTALLFRTTIDCPARFAKSRDVGVHLGLTPRKYASGEVNYDGRITKCGDAMMRHHLYEAALVLLTRGRRWHPLKAWGLRLAKRSSMKNAFVAVARKLAILLHRLWVDGTTFRWTTSQSMPA